VMLLQMMCLAVFLQTFVLENNYFTRGGKGDIINSL